ncbi:nitrogen fixation protein NifR [Staphylococcus aureus]|nr:nitrogen fixation protein NifR [Staphylococcus aureus]PZJ42488.1 nitrogen fixation protein NifR [Staphylococcus aureus]PZK47109.1 nitrogen fixation protein NifR [Staphylococcus aureus]PZK61722.1 nitrogen fixation protein NifR [Staphylococcus aureus]PZL55829.1 nitrogen fixation protein NifR [Staphylococcus aureus]
MKFSEHTSMHVGVGRRNKFCENIISVQLPIKKQP